MSIPSTLFQKKRFKRKDWVFLGLEALKDGGPDSLTVEELCTLASKTRGSFYFHFSTIDDFLRSLADYWTEEFTTRIIERAADGAFERLDLLNQLAGRLDPEIEQGMRQMAARNALISEIVQQADTERINFLSGLYGRSGKYTEDAAQALAKIEYAALIGFQLTMPEMTGEQSRKLYDQFLKLTGRQ